MADMNNSESPAGMKSKLHLQMAAFLVTAVSSLGLYFAVALGPILAVWLLMAFVAVAMILAVCVS
jgi:hypothetical protein